MDSQTYAAMMALLESIDGKVDALVAQQDCFVERIEKVERQIARIWLAVTGGGTALVGVVWYLLQLHLK